MSKPPRSIGVHAHEVERSREQPDSGTYDDEREGESQPDKPEELQERLCKELKRSTPGSRSAWEIGIWLLRVGQWATTGDWIHVSRMYRSVSRLQGASTTLYVRATLVTTTRQEGTIMRVFIAEDQVLVLRGIEQMLTAHGISIAATADNAEGLPAAVLASQADLALLDIRMPPTQTDDGIRVAVELRRRQPGFPVVLLSQYVEQLYFDELLASGEGGVGYLLKDRVFDDTTFVDALRSVASGDTLVDPEVVDRLTNRLPAHGPLAALTPREYEALGHMATGISNTEIAERMFVTEKAVAKHINGIFAKLGLSETSHSSRRVQAVLTYLRR